MKNFSEAQTSPEARRDPEGGAIMRKQELKQTLMT